MLTAMDDGWRPTLVRGVLRRTLVPHADDRGTLREAWRSSWTSAAIDAPVAQVNHTLTRAGALRGLHFHRRQTDIWVVLDGRAHIGLVDIRDLLAGGLGAGQKVELELVGGECLLIPNGVAHGMWALTDVSLLYLVNAEYDGTDEHGFAWDDPTAAIQWPAGTPLLSDRDRSAPSLLDAVRRQSA
jgi:dTDP-4-dehydrorhamnose 3,5-epimerase